jgi:DNA-binding transcriptional ArsR family regulator
MAYAQVLEALADPTRRRMFEQLRRRPRTVGELADSARIRQPTASQHLQVLRRAHLVSDRREGTRRFYRIDTSGLEDLRAYVESMWDGVLSAYANQDSASASPPKRGRRSASAPRRKSR